MKIINLEQGKVDWHAWRNAKLADGGPRIMASDVAAIMGLSPYETAHQLWMRMTGRTGPKTQNFAMKRGHEFEDVVRKRLEKTYGDVITPICCEAEPGEFAPAWSACSLDGVSMSMDLIYEIKVPGRRDFDAMLSGKVPPHWVAQVQWQMLVTGIAQCMVTAFDPGDGVISSEERIVSINVMADRDYQRELIAKATEFRRAVMQDLPLVGHALTARAVAWVRAYDAVKKAEAVLEEAQKALIEAAPQDQRVDTPVAIIIRSQREGGIDYSKLIEDLQISKEDLEKYRKPPSKPTITVRRAAGADAFLEKFEEDLRAEMGTPQTIEQEDLNMEPAQLNW